MRTILKMTLFFCTTIVCCLFFNVDKAFAATKACVKEGDTCNICRESYYSTSCNHVEGRVYESAIYYFYTSDRTGNWLSDSELLGDSSEVYAENVIPISVYYKNDFINGWNSMGYRNGKYYYIRGVVINMHGEKGLINIGDQAGLNNQSWGVTISATDIANLSNKYVERMCLLTCYGAYHYELYNQNTARAFSNKIKGGEVIAGEYQVYGHNDNNDIYYYYVDDSPALINDVFTPSLSRGEGDFDWIIYKDTQVIQVINWDCYTVVTLLSLGETYEESD